MQGMPISKKCTVFIGLGTNLGDREQNLRHALGYIRHFLRIEQASSIYETQPVGFSDQGWFLNMVVRGTTLLSPEELLRCLLSAEAAMGRKRTVRNGPRIIDLDILFYADRIISSEDLHIPHPEIQNRSFVLTPLHEIAPGFIHPKLQKSITALYNDLSQHKQVQKWIKKK